MKGFSFTDLMPVALVFVVAFFIFGIGQNIMDGLQENFCEYSWIDTARYTDGVNGNNTVNNPVTGAKFGCCSSTNATDCLTWSTDRFAINTSVQGSDSIEEMSSWGPTLALVVVASIIIGTLIMYLARGSKV